MSAILLQSFREIAEALLEQHNGADHYDVACSDVANPKCSGCVPIREALHKAAGEMHMPRCGCSPAGVDICDVPRQQITDSRCADLRRRLMEVVG